MQIYFYFCQFCVESQAKLKKPRWGQHFLFALPLHVVLGESSIFSVKEVCPSPNFRGCGPLLAGYREWRGGHPCIALSIHFYGSSEYT